MENGGTDLLYEDLDAFPIPPEFEARVKLLENRIQELENALKHSEENKKTISSNFERDKQSLVSRNQTLRVNISALFKTAKREIERKDKIIRELQQQLDDYHFRRRRPLPVPQRSDVVADDAVDTRSAGPSKLTDVSVVLPNRRNHDLRDVERRSKSGDQSPNGRRSCAERHEFTGKDGGAVGDVVRVGNGDGLTAADGGSKAGSDRKYGDHISAAPFVGDRRDENRVGRNSSDRGHHRRSEGQPSRDEDYSRRAEADDRESRIRFDSKTKDRHRYSPYKHRKEEHGRSRYKGRRHDREKWSSGDDSAGKRAVRRSPGGRSSGDRRELADEGRRRSSKDDFRAQDVEFADRKSHRLECGSLSDRLTPDEQRRRRWRKDAEFVDGKAFHKDDRLRAEPALLPVTRRDLVDVRRGVPVNDVALDSVEKGEKADLSTDEAGQGVIPAGVNSQQADTEISRQKSLENRRRKDDDRPAVLGRLGTDPKLSAEKPRTIYSSRMLALDARRRRAAQVDGEPVDECGGDNTVPCVAGGVNASAPPQSQPHHPPQTNSIVSSQKTCTDESRKKIDGSTLDLCKLETFDYLDKSVNRDADMQELDALIDNVHKKFKVLAYSESTEKRNSNGPQWRNGRKFQPNSKPSGDTGSQGGARKPKLSRASTTSEDVLGGHLEPASKRECRDNSKLSPDGHVQMRVRKPPPRATTVAHSRPEMNTAALTSPCDAIGAAVGEAKLCGQKTGDACSLSPADELVLHGNKRVKLSPRRPPAPPSKTPSSSVDRELGHVATAVKHTSPTERGDAAPPLKRKASHLSPPPLPEERATDPAADKQAKPMPILGQLGEGGGGSGTAGVHATPLKLLNGDEHAYSHFNLVSPIADRPEHVKAALSDPRPKISPIPMVDAGRTWYEVERAAKKSSAPSVERRPVDEREEVSESGDDKSSRRAAAAAAAAAKGDDSADDTPSSVAVPAVAEAAAPGVGGGAWRDKSARWNAAVTTSPFKTCCTVEMRAEQTNDATNGGSGAAGLATTAVVSGTDTTSVEHKVFARKRRTPVIRHAKNFES